MSQLGGPWLRLTCWFQMVSHWQFRWFSCPGTVFRHGRTIYSFHTYSLIWNFPQRRSFMGLNPRCETDKINRLAVSKQGERWGVRGWRLRQRNSKCVKNLHQVYLHPKAAENISRCIHIEDETGIPSFSSLWSVLFVSHKNIRLRGNRGDCLRTKLTVTWLTLIQFIS